MKKVLIIAYYFPPIGGGGVQRALKMAKYLGEFGWEPHILTVAPQEHVSLDESLLSQLPASVTIHRCPEWSLGRSVVRRMMGKGQGKKTQSSKVGQPERQRKTMVQSPSTTTASASIQRSRMKTRLFQWLKRLKDIMLIPDDQVTWLVPAIRLGRKLMQEQGIDAIVSTSGPVTNHLVGLMLSRTWTDKPWIADFRDPWTQNMHRSGIRWREWLEERLERMVLRESDVLLTVTHSFARNFMQAFADEIKRVEVIHNGFDHADYTALQNVEKSEEEKDQCVFIYTGIFYKERNPRLFLQAVKELIDQGQMDRNRIKLKFAGVFDYPGYRDNAEAVERFGLGDIVELLGHLPHAEALRTMKQADVLLLISDTAPNSGDYIPGKLYEYMAIGHPILALSLPGESTKIIETYKLGMTANPLELTDVKRAVLTLYQEWKEGRMINRRKSGQENTISNYERREQARMLAKLLDELSV